MAVQQLIYASVVPLSATRHRDWSVARDVDFGFARAVNSVPVTAVEFAPAAAEFPIVFSGDDSNILPAVILGARDGENLFVDAEGKWRGTYVPAFIRRYPFVFSTGDEGKTLVLNIDETCERVNQEGIGERLFDSRGEQTAYLQGILRFLQDYQAHFLRTQAFCKRLGELDLLQPMQAQFNLDSGERRTLGGFKVVDREKLKALPPEELAGMCRRDELECLYLHLASLRHFESMLKQMSAPSTADAGPDEGAEQAPAEA